MLTEELQELDIEHVRGKLQQAFLDETELGYEVLAYPIKNGEWVDPFEQSGGVYRVALHGISKVTDYGIKPIDNPRKVWSLFTIALQDHGYIDQNNQLTSKGRTILFHACYRQFPIVVGNYCATIETTFVIEGED